jgi:hypothetical protein
MSQYILEVPFETPEYPFGDRIPVEAKEGCEDTFLVDIVQEFYDQCDSAHFETLLIIEDLEANSKLWFLEERLAKAYDNLS